MKIVARAACTVVFALVAAAAVVGNAAAAPPATHGSAPAHVVFVDRQSCR